MDRVHARFPFLRDAKAAVEHADIDLESMIADERSTVLDRAVARVEGAISEGRVPDPSADVRVELLSYPVARILVSLVDDPVLTDRYALAEARRAFELLASEFGSEPPLRSRQAEGLTMEELLSEFDLANRIAEHEHGYEIDVTAFLSLSSELRGPSWRLVNQPLADGTVPIDRGSVETLIQEAIRLRVADDLPLDVPESIATGLGDEVRAIRTTIANISIPNDIDVIAPDAFPPCIQSIYDRAMTEELSDPERFTLVSFLSHIGASEEDLIAIFEPADARGEQLIRYQFEHVHGETRSTAYPPPSCDTLEAMGICDGADVCRTHGHPLAAYEHRLAALQ